MGVTFREFLAVMSGNLLMVLSSIALSWPMRSYSELHGVSIQILQLMYLYLFTGSLIGVVLFSTIAHILGRRSALTSSGLPLAVGFSIIAISGKIEIIYCGHFIAGLSMGGISTVLPIYIGEIARKTSRGILASTILPSFYFGQFLSSCLFALSSYQVHNLLLVVAPMICSVIFFILGPETPYFHAKNNRENIAKAVLEKLRRATSDEIEKELDEIQDRSPTPGKERIMTCFKSNGWLKAMLVLLGLTGIRFDSPWIGAIIGFAPVIGSLTCALMIDRFGRRICLLVSTFGVILFLLPMAIYFTMKIHEINVEFISFLPFVSLIFFIIFYNIGIGPVPIFSWENFFTKVQDAEMEKYEKCLLVLDQHKVPYHTYNKVEARNSSPIFKGVAEDSAPTKIANELKKKLQSKSGARFKKSDAHQCQSSQ
ncbi:hypothetical protein JTB14_031653 [Gonioctena quinquepunctata]|nr:hypothetical protein JTB14_031653 [Gonioctena quinquepunctata]